MVAGDLMRDARPPPLSHGARDGGPRRACPAGRSRRDAGLRTGVPAPPPPLAGLSRLWRALERHVPDRVADGAWEALLRLEEGAVARPPLGALPNPVALAPPAPRRVAGTVSSWFGRCLFVGLLVLFLAL